MATAEAASDAESVVRHAIKNAAAATMAAADLLANHRDRLDPAQVEDVLARIHHRGAAIIRMVDELGHESSPGSGSAADEPEPAGVTVPVAHDHHVLFHDGPDDLIERLTDFALAGLHGGEAVLVLANRTHEDRLCRSLATRGVQVEAERASGRLQLGGAEATLAALMDGGRPDPDRFEAVVGNLVRHTVSRWHEVRIYGEMVSILWDRGAVGAALELEDLWNGLRQGIACHLVCGYASSVDADPHGGAAVRARHGAVVA